MAAVRDGEAFVKRLRDDREVWYDGRRVDDVTTFPPFAASVRSLARLQATVDPDNGVLYPDLFALQAGRALGPVYYPELLDMLRRVGGGGLVQLPVSLSEFDSPVGADLARSLRGAGIAGRDKARLFMLARDLVGSEFGARHELYEVNYAGERGGILAGIQREYTRKARYLEHLERFMRDA